MKAGPMDDGSREPPVAVAQGQPKIEPITSALKATAVLSSSSIVSILVGLVSAKAWAVLLGPAGLGYMGLLQSLVALAGLVAGAGLGTGLIRLGASAKARGDHLELASLHRAAWLLFWGIGSFAMLLMIVLREPISRYMLGGPEHSGSVVLMALAMLLSLASGLQVSTLNAYHRIKALAKVGILGATTGTCTSLALVWIWREQGIAPAIILSTAAGLAVSSYFLRREIGPLPVRPTREATLQSARSLLRFGGPYMASTLVGTGVQFVLPVLVLHNLGTESVGFYRAAVAISVTYLGFLLSAMGMDYYPRVSAARDQPAVLVQLVNQQLRLVLMLAIPLIFGLLVLAPYLVPLIYSPEFALTVDVLEWQLTGDLLKFASWTIGTVILARSDSITVFLVELVAGICFLAFSWLGIRWFGLIGLGTGFLATYVVHCAVVWAVVRRDIGLTLTPSNKGILFAAVLGALLLGGLSFMGLEAYQTGVGIALAALAGIGSLYFLRLEIVRARTHLIVGD